MAAYLATLIGEDHSVFTIKFDADTRDDAWSYLDEMWPEAVVEHLRTRDDDAAERAHRYARLNAEMDEDRYYD